MEFRILGGLEVLKGGRQLALGSPQQRAVLAILLVNRGRTVSVDELIDELWPERQPSSAAHAVEVYVSRLRKVLHADGATRLETTGHGYALRVEPDEIDAEQFERLFERGRNARSGGRSEAAAAVLRRALALWRGEPFAELPCGPGLRAAAARMEELRLSALEERIEADLARGRHASVIPELEALVAAEPLRERLRGQLMVALYRDDRQADALAAYQSARTMLREELGLQPSRALQDLERAILNQDPALDLTPRRVTRRVGLPARVTPLVGREAELEHLIELLRTDDVRLVTVTGTGGIGKTRLAVEAARRLEEEYGEGVAFVDLAATRQPELVGQAVANALGIEEQPGTLLLDTIASQVGKRASLLLFDNFEHVIEAAPIVSELLARTERLKVLVTSRLRLNLYGEHDYPVSPLPVPPAGEREIEKLMRFGAVELFIACARRRAAGFKLEPENARAVGEICIRLDGMPLAIELAAARSRAHDPAALLEQLESRLPVLVGGPRDAPERQRSLRAAIDWSYDLLDSTERRAFERLSVFSGGCTADAFAAVCEADASTLESLVERNLVVREPAGVPRFWLLETIREYGLERLQDSGALDEVRRRHAEFFAAFAERAEPELRGPEQLGWLSRLDAEQSNISAAFAWALDAGQFDLPLRIGGCLWRYWEARGSISEARRRIDDALARSAGHASDARSAALFASGRMALRQGHLDHARTVFAEGRNLFEAADDKGGIALCTAALGWVAHVVGPADESVGLCQAAVELARESGEEWVIADALNNLGVALRTAGDLTGSRAALEESLALRRSIGDLEGITAGLNGLALIAIAEDDFDEAEKLFGEAFAISEKRDDLFYAAAKSVVFAYLAFGRGDLHGATTLSVRALETCRQNGYQQFMAYAFETLAGVAAAEGRLRQAGRLLGAAISIAERIGRAGELGGATTGTTQRDGVTYDWEARAVKRVLQDAARKLGSGAWNAAIEEGRELEVDEAHAFAAEWAMSPDERRPDHQTAPSFRAAL
jgi:predicted ATPase/DNA-binding SARP family transcriptional activator